MKDVFAPQVFFIVFRECLEAVVILSVLFSFLKQSLGGPDQDPKIYKQLRRQVWLGSISGVACCLVIGGAFIGVFYAVGTDIWSDTEDLWEGIFYLIATIIITIMGLALLRINKTKEKWRVKLAQALVERRKRSSGKGWFASLSRRYIMFIIPWLTTMREGVEAVVFVGGVSLGYPATAFPLPVITGFLAAMLVAYGMYRGGNQLSIRVFLIISSCILYLIAAGMFSKSMWSLQYHVFSDKVGSDVAEEGNGPGSYDILENVWHVDCCNPETDNGWDVFNALLGWENSASYGSVIAYNVYWLFLIATLFCLMYEEKHGSLPLKRSITNFLLKVPLVSAYIRRKQVATGKAADDLVAQTQRELREQARRQNSSDDEIEVGETAITEEIESKDGVSHQTVHITEKA